MAGRARSSHLCIRDVIKPRRPLNDSFADHVTHYDHRHSASSRWRACSLRRTPEMVLGGRPTPSVAQRWRRNGFRLSSIAFAAAGRSVVDGCVSLRALALLRKAGASSSTSQTLNPWFQLVRRWTPIAHAPKVEARALFPRVAPVLRSDTSSIIERRDIWSIHLPSSRKLRSCRWWLFRWASRVWFTWLKGRRFSVSCKTHNYYYFLIVKV